MTEAEIFAGRLDNGSRKFFLRMNEILENEGLIIQHDDNRVTYFPDTNRKQPRVLKKQQPLVLRYTMDNKGLTVELKLNFIDCQTDIIEKMPEHIKKMFQSIRCCCQGQEFCDRPWINGSPVWIDGSPNCGLRRTYTLINIILTLMFPIPMTSNTTRKSYKRKYRRQKRGKNIIQRITDERFFYTVYFINRQLLYHKINNF